MKKALEKKELDICEKTCSEMDRNVFAYLRSHTWENRLETARLLSINCSEKSWDCSSYGISKTQS